MAGVQELGGHDDRQRGRRRPAFATETALLRDAFVARLRSGREMATVADTPSLDDVLRRIDVARQRTGTLEVILLHHLGRSIGALRVSSRAILASPEKLLPLLQGDVFVTTQGAEDGLALSAITRHVSRTEDRNEYSLALWAISPRPERHGGGQRSQRSSTPGSCSSDEIVASDGVAKSCGMTPGPIHTARIPSDFGPATSRSRRSPTLQASAAEAPA